VSLPPRLSAARDFIAEVVSSDTADAAEDLELSVVIPSYQHGEFVAIAATAALTQSYQEPFEVIVVDDGSTDQTGEVMRHLAATTSGRLRYARLQRNAGRSTARNAGIALARGALVAFTDSDCRPAEGWLRHGARPFVDRRIGAVQGTTGPAPEQRRPFFNHFIEIDRFDGTYSTCNVFFRREALIRVDGFDPSVVYWEDLDLGWRVRRDGWRAVPAPDAEVHHQVIELSPWQWLCWPRHLAYMPAKVARYPEYRRFLFLGLFLGWFQALFDLAVVALILGARAHRGFFVLALPYAAAFPFQRGLAGRAPPAKVAMHVAWDAISLGVLLVSSLRHRAPVL
jgi:glycosyltransferase involved in cell wall biosynthesis